MTGLTCLLYADREVPMNEAAADQGRHLDPTKLARLTTDVIVAYTSNNATAVTDLADLIKTEPNPDR